MKITIDTSGMTTTQLEDLAAALGNIDDVGPKIHKVLEHRVMLRHEVYRSRAQQLLCDMGEAKEAEQRMYDKRDLLEIAERFAELFEITGENFDVWLHHCDLA